MTTVPEVDELGGRGYHLMLRALAVLIAHRCKAERVEDIGVGVVLLVMMSIILGACDEAAFRNMHAIGEGERLERITCH